MRLMFPMSCVFYKVANELVYKSVMSTQLYSCDIDPTTLMFELDLDMIKT